MQDVLCTCHEQAGAAGAAEHALVAGARGAVVVFAGVKRAPVDRQFAVEQMQLLGPGMRMGRIARAGRQAHQHADPASFAVVRQKLALDAGRDLLPLRLRPPSGGRRQGRRGDVLGDAAGKPFL
jgi:hypothetical protein